MSFLIIYAIFALATSLASLYELVAPVVNKRKNEGLETMPIPLVYFTFFCINVLIAPLVFLSCIIPDWSDRFQVALYEGLYSNE